MFDVRTFFGEVCPNVLALQAEQAKKLGGSVGFRIFGAESGAWLVDLSRARVEERLAFEADAFLELDGEDLIGMLRGTLDLDAAIAGGRIRCRGDVAMLTKLGALLQG